MLLLLLLLLLLFSSFDYLANLIGFLSKKKFGHLILKLKTFNFFSLCYFLNRIVVRSQKFKNNLTVGEVKSDNNYTSTYFFNSYHMVPPHMCNNFPFGRWCCFTRHEICLYRNVLVEGHLKARVVTGPPWPEFFFLYI